LRETKPKLKASIVALLVVCGALGTVAIFAAGSAQATPACSVTVHAENGADDAIQSAINTYPGGVICIGAGIFPEQLTISSSHTVLVGAGATKTIIEPNGGAPGPGVLTNNTVDWDSAPASGGVTCGTSTCVALAAIILVDSPTPPPAMTPTTGVTIEDLEVDGGAAASNIGCGGDYVGVDFQDAAGTLTSANVLNVYTSAFGCQEVSGAVYAYNGYFYSGIAPSPSIAVAISHTTVTGYQKNGISCDDSGETCAVKSDTVIGAGPITTDAQNGIQIAYGAYASVEKSTISDNSYTGSTSTNDWYGSGYVATGLLLYDPATGTTVSGNTLLLNQVGIAYTDDGTYDSGSESVTISHNTVKESAAYGIVANGASGGGDFATISSNTVNNEHSLNPSIWGAPGILVDTGTFDVVGNSILGSSTGTGGSSGPSQTVCAPSGYPIVCSSTESIATAAIQGVSESGSGMTTLYISSNDYTADSYRLATLGVNGGAVNVEEVD
jgi:hypothetical protein